MDESSNSFITRVELINKNSVFHANFIPRIDTLSLSKYFPPGNTLTFGFIRSPNHFALLAPDNTKSHKITHLDMVLEVRQFLPPEAIESKLQNKLNDLSFHLPITSLVPRTRGLHVGIYDGSVTNAITGICPSHLMIFLLSN